MCSIMDRIECYVDDIVDCFEEFVGKALVMLFVAVGTGLVMIIYALKLINDRLEGIPCIGFRGGLGNTPRPQDQQCPIDCTSRNVTAKGSHSRVQELQDEIFNNNNNMASNEECVDTEINTSDKCAKKTEPKSKEKAPDICVCPHSKSKPGTEKESNLNDTVTTSCRPIAATPSNSKHQVPCPRSKCRKHAKTKFSAGVHADDSISFITLTKDLKRHFYLCKICLWTIYKSFRVECYSYVLLATVLAVVVSSFLLPNISRTVYETKKVKEMKKVVNVMSKEVTRAEVACLTAADDVRCLHCSMHDSGTEITLRSYIYTNSFDAKKN